MVVSRARREPFLTDRRASSQVQGLKGEHDLVILKNKRFVWLSTGRGAGERVRKEVAKGSCSTILYALQAVARRLYFFSLKHRRAFEGI